MRKKIKKRVKNQSGFLKHAIIYFIILTFFLVMATFIRAEEFFIGFGMPMFFWAIGLSIHFASAFLFNRINSWKETKYQEELNRLQLDDPTERDQEYYEDFEDDHWDDEVQFDLKELERQRESSERKKWGEGDFV
nr:2TM domain-containing protein [Membranihabitans maritimus]